MVQVKPQELSIQFADVIAMGCKNMTESMFYLNLFICIKYLYFILP